MTPLLFLLCASPYIRHSLDFPHVPYDVALRHIHTPEQCVDVYGMVPPGFRILQTITPMRMDTYDVVQFTFTTVLGGVRHASLFSSEADSSQILFFNASLKPSLLASLSVKPHGTGGHRLLVTGSYLREPDSALERLLTRRAVSKKAIHDAVQLGYRGSVGKPEDPNLKEYRRRVLSLE
jgi:hypothetical protein